MFGKIAYRIRIVFLTIKKIIKGIVYNENSTFGYMRFYRGGKSSN